MSKFGENLKALRIYHHLTQDQLADKLGLTNTTIHGYEAGKREPNHEIEESIADYFNVSLDELRGYKPIDFSVQNDCPEIQMTVNFMREMDNTTQRALLTYAEFLWKTYKEMNGGNNDVDSNNPQ